MKVKSSYLSLERSYRLYLRATLCYNFAKQGFQMFGTFGTDDFSLFIVTSLIVLLYLPNSRGIINIRINSY